MPDYEKSYLGELRQLVGKRKLIVACVRAIVRDEQGRVLFIRRRDNGVWAMPAGSMELDESILDCLKREVREETGLEVVAATPIAIYSDPKYASTTVYGDPYQFLTVVFRVDAWTGDLVTETDETLDARFFALGDLPDTRPLYHETLADLQQYDGRLILK